MIVADIYIVGLGVLNVDQLTREVERVIRRSNEVLYVDTGVATRAHLASLCPRVTSLFESSYEESSHRLNAYHHMAARVLDAALDHPPVTFAIHGHPIVGVYAPFLIRDMAGLLNLEVQVLPGISAMDCLFAELMVDPCVTGMQMYEATDLLLRRRPLQPDVPALIWQIGCVETTLHTMRVSNPEALRAAARSPAALLPSRPPGVSLLLESPSADAVHGVSFRRAGTVRTGAPAALRLHPVHPRSHRTPHRGHRTAPPGRQRRASPANHTLAHRQARTLAPVVSKS